MITRALTVIRHYNAVTRPIAGLWGRDGLGKTFAGRPYVVLALRDGIVRAGIGMNLTELTTLDPVKHEGIHEIGVALVQMKHLAEGGRCTLSFSGMNEAEARDAIRSIVRRHQFQNPLMVGKPDHLDDLPARTGAWQTLYASHNTAPEVRVVALTELVELDAKHMETHLLRGIDDHQPAVRNKTLELIQAKLAEIFAPARGEEFAREIVKRRGALPVELLMALAEIFQRRVGSHFAVAAATILQRTHPDQIDLRTSILDMVAARAGRFEEHPLLVREIKLLASAVINPLAPKARAILEDLEPIAPMKVAGDVQVLFDRYRSHSLRNREDEAAFHAFCQELVPNLGWRELIELYAVPDTENAISAEGLTKDRTLTELWIIPRAPDDRKRMARRVRRVLSMKDQSNRRMHLRFRQIQYKVATILLPHVAFSDTDPDEVLVHMVVALMSQRPDWRPGLLRALGILGKRYSNGALHFLAQTAAYDLSGSIRLLARNLFAEAVRDLQPGAGRVADRALSNLTPIYLINAVAHKKRIAVILGFDESVAVDDEPFDADSEDTPRAMVQRAVYVLWKTGHLDDADLDRPSIYALIHHGIRADNVSVRQAAQRVWDVDRTRPGT